MLYHSNKISGICPSIVYSYIHIYIIHQMSVSLSSQFINYVILSNEYPRMSKSIAIDDFIFEKSVGCYSTIFK